MEEELKITESCRLVKYEYCDEVCLEYFERSPDGWYSDSETTIDIDKETAEKIIAMLKKAYTV